MADNYDELDDQLDEVIDMDDDLDEDQYSDDEEPLGDAGNDEEWEDAEEAEEADDPIADLLFEVVSRMGFKGVDIEWEERRDHIRYFVEGEELGALIGRHGSTLEALQYLVGVVNSRRSLVSHKIIVDVEGYRERREGRLRRLAQHMAREAIRGGQEIAFEPMPPGDRRVIHLALSGNSLVTTFSEGENADRFVVVAPRRDRN